MTRLAFMAAVVLCCWCAAGDLDTSCSVQKMQLGNGTGGVAGESQYSVVMPNSSTTFTATSGTATWNNGDYYAIGFMFDGSTPCDIDGTCVDPSTGNPASNAAHCYWMPKTCPSSLDLAWTDPVFVSSIRVDFITRTDSRIDSARIFAHPPANAINNEPVEVTPPFMTAKLRASWDAFKADPNCNENGDASYDAYKNFLDIPIGMWVERISFVLVQVGSYCGLSEIEVLYDACGPTSRPGTNWKTGLTNFLAKMSQVEQLAPSSAGAPSCLLTVHWDPAQVGFDTAAVAGMVTKWKVEPPLPEGAEIDESSGVISGIVWSSSLREELKYTVFLRLTLDPFSANEIGESETQHSTTFQIFWPTPDADICETSLAATVGNAACSGQNADSPSSMARFCQLRSQLW